MGSYAIWNDPVKYVNIDRPQDSADGSTSLTRLGIPRRQSWVFVPVIQQTNHALSDYVDSLANDLLGGDISLLASKLTTPAQAIGFVMSVLANNRRQHKDIGPTVKIILKESEEIIEGTKAVIHLEYNISNMSLLENPSYDLTTNI